MLILDADCLERMRLGDATPYDEMLGLSSHADAAWRRASKSGTIYRRLAYKAGDMRQWRSQAAFDGNEASI